MVPVKATVPNAVPLAVKVTFPVAGVVPVVATVEVKVTLAPVAEGFVVLVRVVVVAYASLDTTTVTGVLLLA